MNLISGRRSLNSLMSNTESNIVIFNPETTTIKELMFKLNVTVPKVLVLIDELGALVGTVTDGDIRRALLRGGAIDTDPMEVVNSKPFYLRDDEPLSLDKEIRLLDNLILVPVVSKEMKLIKILSSTSTITATAPLEGGFFKSQVLVMAGGKGVRLMPITETIPKPLVRVSDDCLIDIAIRPYIKSGLRDFIFSVGYMSEKVIEYVERTYHDYRIEFLVDDFPLGTAGPIHFLSNQNQTNIFVVNCDVVSDYSPENVYNFHNQNEADMTVCISEQAIKLPFGIVNFDDDFKLDSIKEKPEIFNWSVAGIYLLSGSCIDFCKKNYPKGHLDMPDLIEKCLKAGKRIIVYPLGESWSDIGRYEELEKLRKGLDSDQ